LGTEGQRSRHAHTGALSAANRLLASRRPEPPILWGHRKPGRYGEMGRGVAGGPVQRDQLGMATVAVRVGAEIFCGEGVARGRRR
jgi:hypothetical protein